MKSLRVENCDNDAESFCSNEYNEGNKSVKQHGCRCNNQPQREIHNSNNILQAIKRFSNIWHVKQSKRISRGVARKKQI